MPSQSCWAGFERMLLINDLFFNSSVVAQRVTKLGAPRAQHLGLNCIYKIYEGVHHGEGNTVTSNKFCVKQWRYLKGTLHIHII